MIYPKFMTVVIGSVGRNSTAAWNTVLYDGAPAVVTDSVKVMPPNDRTTIQIGNGPGNIFKRMPRDILHRINRVVVMPNYGDMTADEIIMAHKYMLPVQYLKYTESGAIETDRFSQQ